MKKYLNKILKVIFYLTPLLSLIVIFKTDTFVKFGVIAYYMLIIIMFSRPLRDIFPKKLKWLNQIIIRRKELGIIIGVFAIAHSIGFFLDTGVSLSLMLNPHIRSLDNYMAWGFVAFFVTIPLLLTSNIFSMKKLGRNWKRVQYLAYIMFITTILHVAFISDDNFYISMGILFSYLFVLFYAGYLNRKKRR